MAVAVEDPVETAEFPVAHHLIEKRDPMAGVFQHFLAIFG